MMYQHLFGFALELTLWATPQMKGVQIVCPWVILVSTSIGRGHLQTENKINSKLGSFSPKEAQILFLFYVF